MSSTSPSRSAADAPGDMSSETQRFTASYLERTRRALDAIDHGEVDRCCEALLACTQRDGTVFIAGNGGSAALADHLACDLTKGALGRAYFHHP